MQTWSHLEMGCRGFPGQSLHRVLGLLGICGLRRQRAIKTILECFAFALDKEGGDAWRSTATWTQMVKPDRSRLGRPGEGV